jgi:hypothetical protein
MSRAKPFCLEMSRAKPLRVFGKDLEGSELVEVMPEHAEVGRVTEALPAEVRTLDGLNSLRMRS